MKVWEETWEAQRYVIEMAGDARRHLGQFVDDEDDPNDPACDRNRATLAAAAPEMARLLLDIVGRFERGDSAGEIGDWLADSDEMVTALRKAGVPLPRLAQEDK